MFMKADLILITVLFFKYGSKPTNNLIFYLPAFIFFNKKCGFNGRIFKKINRFFADELMNAMHFLHKSFVQAKHNKSGHDRNNREDHKKYGDGISLRDTIDKASG